MRASARRRRDLVNIWPGFVDLLSNLLIIILFLLLLFTLAQFFLAEALSGRDVALDRLNRQLMELTAKLSVEQSESESLRRSAARLSSELTTLRSERDRLAGEADSGRVALTVERSRAQALEARASGAEERLALAQKEIEKRDLQLTELGGSLGREREQTTAARTEVARLNSQIEALRQQLARLATVLEAAETKAREQDVQIANLGQRLNLALAGKVEELARYRSEFFGRLREVLGERQDIRVEGDRFVFQSEVLFDSGAAEIKDEGRVQITRLAETLKELNGKIPADINWVLRIDGHTDRVPIRNAAFPSNWELSTGRAIAVVKFLVGYGIPPQRLAATGFGEFRPLDARNDEIGYRRNRRIEFRLTDR